MGVGHSHDGAHGHGHGHDYADRVDDALADSATGIRAVKISLIAHAATAIVQSSSGSRARWPSSLTPSTTSPTR
jgi:hypothetical protein